ncbi:hypothetical protein Tcan_05938 [Toxocara canis]|uniref:Uncharacterized protein n=1 Tax=Toxocara canis TaxID=6265 RepID=A0A0B2VIM9_TOXCA|nr:hypothetical protein Tcan_05938 [Toxocara canis]
MLLLRFSPGRITLPSTSTIKSVRSITQLPPSIAAVFEYAQYCNLTTGAQFVFEGIHDLGLPWVGTIMLSGLALRIITSPTHILAEKLFAKRLHATNFLSQEILKRLSAHYKIDVVPSKDGKRLQLNTTDEEILRKSNEMCIPLYWLVVSASGIVQSLMLRHPRVKALLGIQRLPTDSHRPFRDLFFLRHDKFI